MKGEDTLIWPYAVIYRHSIHLYLYYKNIKQWRLTRVVRYTMKNKIIRFGSPR